MTNKTVFLRIDIGPEDVKTTLIADDQVEMIREALRDLIEDMKNTHFEGERIGYSEEDMLILCEEIIDHEIALKWLEKGDGK